MMPESLDGLTFRRPTAADAQAVLELMIACDLSEYGLVDSDMGDLKHEWSQVDLEQDAWLAFQRGGEMVGYAIVMPWGHDLRYEYYVDPSWPGKSLSQALLTRCQERGPAIAQASKYSEDSVARTFIPHTNQRNIEVVEEAGFQPGKYVFNMRLQMDSMPAKPVWPEGILFRHAISGQDDQAIYTVIQGAFDRPDWEPRPFEDWLAAMTGPDNFDPELWFLALSGDEIVGACLTFAYPDEGWVRQLGVDVSWQGKGIGTALLRHTFRVYKERGFEAVSLAVEADNPRAYKLYESAGMERIRQYDEYLKKLRRE
jgi:mycothiol synthase